MACGACGQTTCTARTEYSIPPLQQNCHTIPIQFIHNFKTMTHYSIQFNSILELERIQYKTDYTNDFSQHANLEKLRERYCMVCLCCFFPTFNIGCHNCNLLITLLHGTRSSKKVPDCQRQFPSNVFFSRIIHLRVTAQLCTRKCI